MIMGWGAAVAKLLEIVDWLLRRKKKRIQGGHTPEQSLSGTFDAVQPGFLICSALSRVLGNVPELSRVLLAYCHDGNEPLTVSSNIYTTILCEQHSEGAASAVSLFEPRKVTSAYMKDVLSDMVRDNKDTSTIIQSNDIEQRDPIRTYYQANKVGVAVLRPVFVAADQSHMYFLSFHFPSSEGDKCLSPVVEQALVDCVSEVALLVPRIMEHA